jgi:hypothetical protein
MQILITNTEGMKNLLCIFLYLKEIKKMINTYLTKGTLIYTQKGYIPIEDITINTPVLTHWGFWKEVTAIDKKTTTSFYRISGKGMLPTLITPESKILIKNSIVDTLDWREINRVTDSVFSSFVIPKEHEDNDDEIELFNNYLLDELKIKDEKEIDKYYAFINGGYLFRKVISNELITTAETECYGIEVAGEKSYIANGMIVHC